MAIMTHTYRFRVESVSEYSTLRPLSMCHTQEQADRLAIEHAMHLPGCKTEISEINPLIYAPVVKTMNEQATEGFTFDGEVSSEFNP